MSIYKTEITSDKILSDNPIHQRLLKPYVVIRDQIKGDVLELGCGEGRGIEQILGRVSTYLGLDKNDAVIKKLKIRYPDTAFMQTFFPPVPISENEQFDCIISFQVIEHIKDDRMFLEEIYRLLRPGGMAIITTPNREMSLSRNPWHIREYTAPQLMELCGDIFDKVTARGISGNDKVMQYYEDNKRSVARIMKFDIFDLQHKLPAIVLKVPYEILNRINRNSLKKDDHTLIGSISHEDYLATDNTNTSLDLFYYLHKK
jgi:SAM-dependent methyltransferase